MTVRIPLLVRRGGCGITKKSRSHRSAADGVVAHTHMFQNAFRNVTCERPPRPRLFGPGPFLDARLKAGLISIFLLQATRNPSRNPCFWTENSGHLKLVYDDAALPSKPNGVCCNKKYGSRIQDIQRSARKPFCASFWAYVGVNRACITGSPGFMASFCLR